MRQVEIGGVTTSEYLFGGASVGGVGSAPSRVGLGMRTDEALERLDEGYELGIRGIDTANSFAVGESERVIGRWREERERADVLIATKVGNVVERGQDEVDLSAAHIERQLALSLSRLGAVDVYLTHGTDHRTPLEETVTAFAEAIDTERIRAWGCSNVTVREAEAWMLAADRAGLPRPALMQNTFSLVAKLDARDLLPLLATEGIAFAAFSTLAGGILSDRLLDGDPDELPLAPAGSRLAIAPAMYRDAFTLPVFERVRQLRAVARELDVSTATLALAWVRAHPQVTVSIVSPRRSAQWDDVTDSLALDLDDDVFQRVAALFPRLDGMPLILPFETHEPDIHESAWVAPNATLIGQVTLAERSSVFYGTVLRADRDAIVLGAGSNLQDNVTVHCDPGSPVRIGSGVSVGHAAVLHGCIVEDDCLIGMGATVLNRAVIGTGSLVAAGAVVLEDTVIPPRSLVAGVPAKVRRELSDDEVAHVRQNAATYLEISAAHALIVLPE